MRNLIVFLIIMNVQVTANSLFSQEQVNLDLENVSLKKCIKEIDKQTKLGFLYNGKELSKVDIYKVKFTNASVEEVLDKLLKENGYTYRIFNDVLLVKKDKSYRRGVGIETIIQLDTLNVTGTVYDEKGNPLPGVSIYFEETPETGTATDIDGKYKITKVLEKQNTLVFSYIGFEAQVIEVRGRPNINITLRETTLGLDEVVVVGYGTQQKERIGSAVSQVKSEEIEDRAAGAVSFEQILGGQIKGVQISQESGAPGAQSTVRVRGITSPFASGNNQPLYVIDGVIFNIDASFNVGMAALNSEAENPLLGINPNDIESISVLKDAGATAIYGSRGANGVIIISTKQGKKNTKNNIRLDYTFNMSNPIKTQDILNTEEYKQLHRMIANNTIDAYNAGFASSSSYYSALLVLDPDTREFHEGINNVFTGETIPLWGEADTDWQNELYNKNAPTHQYNMSVDGGNSNTDYALSINLTSQDGMVINDELKRYGARLNLNTDINEWLKIGTKLSYVHTKNFNGGGSSGIPAVSASMRTRPDYAVYTDEGEFQKYPWLWVSYGSGTGYYYRNEANPVAKRYNRNMNKSNMFNGNAYLSISPIKGLTLKGEINVGNYHTKGESFSPKRLMATSTFGSPVQSSLINSFSENTNIISNFQGNYNTILAERHIVDVMLGYTVDRAFYSREYQTYYGTLDDDIMTNSSSATSHSESHSGKAESGINSYYSRLQYSFDGKYTATFNFRSDESSKFGLGNRTAYFPAVALSWNIKGENFLNDVQAINNLKLRGSYGKTGSANVADFSYLQYFAVGIRGESVYEGSTALINSSVFPNRNIGWETTKELNVGIDFAAFDNRIYGSIDVYDKYTDGILAPAPIFLESGATSFTDNLAEVSNKGLEIGIGGYLIRNSDFSWSLDLNYAHNRNKVESIEGTTISPLSDTYIVGEPVGTIKGYIVEKIIQDEAEIKALNDASPVGFYDKPETGPGDYLYKDLNGDGRITIEDREIIGSMEPDFFGGFSTNLRYKGFELGAYFQYSVGNEKVWANYGSMITNVDLFDNSSLVALNETWTKDRTDAKYSRLIYNSSANARTNDRNIQDASYLRLKVLRLTYNLPQNFLEKISISKAQIYLSTSNLLTFTKYKGLDPEGGAAYMGGAATGADIYPFAKTFSLGLSLNF